MPDEMNDIFMEGKKMTKLVEIGAVASHESSLLFRQELLQMSQLGKEIIGEDLIDAYHRCTTYAIVKFWKLYHENYAEIREEILQNQEELMRKIN